MAKTDSGTGGEAANVAAAPADPKFLIIRCGECDAEIDRVEYDAAAKTPPAVVALQSALGVSERQARSMVEAHNPDALQTQEEAARTLAADIAAGEVADRPRDTYACPNGHDAGLEVTQ